MLSARESSDIVMRVKGIRSRLERKSSSVSIGIVVSATLSRSSLHNGIAVERVSSSVRFACFGDRKWVLHHAFRTYTDTPRPPRRKGASQAPRRSPCCRRVQPPLLLMEGSVRYSECPSYQASSLCVQGLHDFAVDQVFFRIGRQAP